MLFEIPQIPVAGMRGQDDFFTRGQMCLSLFQIVRPRRRRRRRQRRQGERRAIRAHCRSRPVASSTQVTRPERSGALGAVTLRPAREPLRRSCGRRRRRRAPVWPQLSPAAAPSSNYEGSAGAVVYPASIRGPSASSRALHTSLFPGPFPRPTRRPSLPHLSSAGPPQNPSSAPHHPLQRSPAKPRATNENTH